MTIEEKIDDLIDCYNATAEKMNNVHKRFSVCVIPYKRIEDWRWSGSSQSFYIIDYYERFKRDNPQIEELMFIKIDMLISNTTPSECLTSSSEYIRKYKQNKINEVKKNKLKEEKKINKKPFWKRIFKK